MNQTKYATDVLSTRQMKPTQHNAYSAIEHPTDEILTLNQT